uniref:NeoNectin candidate 2 n=1 Tax=synthetic construct TaxID=32630 RepID=UPI003D81C63D
MGLNDIFEAQKIEWHEGGSGGGEVEVHGRGDIPRSSLELFEKVAKELGLKVERNHRTVTVKGVSEEQIRELEEVAKKLGLWVLVRVTEGGSLEHHHHHH